MVSIAVPRLHTSRTDLRCLQEGRDRPRGARARLSLDLHRLYEGRAQGSRAYPVQPKRTHPYTDRPQEQRFCHLVGCQVSETVLPNRLLTLL